MSTLTEKFLLYFAPALTAGLAVGTLVAVVAPTVRQLLFSSSLWSTHVKAQVQEAYIVGSYRVGLVSGSAAGQGGDGPKLRVLKFYIVAQYQYRGKTYTTRTGALYAEDVSIPGSPGGGSDEEYFKTAVGRLRGVAPNTAYTFLQSNTSELRRSSVKRAMAEIPEGIRNAEMDIPIVKWAPSWNYYNLPFTDGFRKGPLLFLIITLICGILPVLAVVQMLKTAEDRKYILMNGWPGWIFGAFLVLLITYKFHQQNHKFPAAKDLDETVPSSQIHRS
jgi:uncharacterized membrane protein